MVVLQTDEAPPPGWGMFLDVLDEVLEQEEAPPPRPALPVGPWPEFMARLLPPTNLNTESGR